MLHIQDGGVYTTDWTAYPLRMERHDIAGQPKGSMLLALLEDGKDGGFQGILQIDCDQPAESKVTTGNDGLRQYTLVSLKDMMKNDSLPRKVVSNIFAMFCTGANPTPADLNMTRE
ncbi:hypothetical protein R52603_01477 [Paraburkholderia saeva]|nr:hypothetical protein R52603_01477 [Paraburkholderia saeva]CAG4921205.1 hypothetical protein R70241_04932 [Paraburkholderia saeva]